LKPTHSPTSLRHFVCYIQVDDQTREASFDASLAKQIGRSERMIEQHYGQDQRLRHTGLDRSIL